MTKPPPPFGVYGIFFPDGHVYIGSTITNIHTRFRIHKHALNQGNHDNTMMQQLWTKYGGEGVDFRILEEATDKDKVRDLEQFYIEQLGATHELCNEIPALQEGNALPEAARKKISDGMKKRGKIKHRTIFKEYMEGEERKINEIHQKNLELRQEQGW